MPNIDGDRLLRDLYALRKIGEYKTGVHRPTYSDDDMKAREWFADRAREAGLQPEIDGIGNVICRTSAPGPQLLLGSHLETQPYAGWLDGALGVLFGLEVARALGHGIEVGAWADEEGHFGNFLGSHSFVRGTDDATIAATVNRHDGTKLPDALRKAGLTGRPRALLDPSRYLGYLEAHIEQGDELDTTGLKIGVVTSIVGIWQYSIRFEGVQNHAGTTRMAIRKDAGVALMELGHAIRMRFPGVAAKRSVWTVGRILLEPGAASIVPGGAEMLFQFRDADAAVLQRMEHALEELVAEANHGPCKVTLTNLSRSTPKLMETRFQDALERAAERAAPGKHIRIPSGAGHDAQIFAEKLPSAMLFVPSIGGISHHWTEDTKDDDIVLGCQAFADAAAEILAA